MSPAVVKVQRFHRQPGSRFIELSAPTNGNPSYMPRKTPARRRPAPTSTAAPSKPWSAQDVRTLRQMAGKEPRARIARALRRSPAAVTFKAFKLRVSLRVVRARTRGAAATRPTAARRKAR